MSKFNPGDIVVLYSHKPYAVLCKVIGYSSREGYLKVCSPEGSIAEVHQDQLQKSWYEKKTLDKVNKTN